MDLFLREKFIRICSAGSNPSICPLCFAQCIDGDEQQFDQVGFDDFNGTSTHRHLSQGAPPRLFAGELPTRGFIIDSKANRQGMRQKKLKSLIWPETLRVLSISAKRAEGNPVPAAATHPVVGERRNRYRALALLQRHAMKSARRHQPGGFRDREEAVLMDPQLSTVRVHKEEIRRDLCGSMLLSG